MTHFRANVPEEIFKDGQPLRDGMMNFILKEMGAEMKFKVGDRVKVVDNSLGQIKARTGDKFVITEVTNYGVKGGKDGYSWREWQLEPARLSRKEIRKELLKLNKIDMPYLMSYHIFAVCEWIKVAKLEKRKVIRARLRQLSAEAFCVDKVLAERIDQLADGV
jgi:hypothetical protein